jgi:arabinofuranan 3-O-arabinosyltransferase
MAVINVVFFSVAFFSHWWTYDARGLGIPTDFVNVWAAGRPVLDDHSATDTEAVSLTHF